MIKKGFTLTEVLVIISIVAIVIGAISSAYLLSQRAYQQGEIAAEITQNGRVILERLAREIRQAREIVTELADEQADATSTIMFQDGHDMSSIRYIHYFQDSTDLRRRVIVYYFSGDPETYVPWDAIPPEPQTLETTVLQDQVIGECLNNLQFWGPGIINIFATLEKKSKIINLQTKIYGRNI